MGRKEYRTVFRNLEPYQLGTHDTCAWCNHERRRHNASGNCQEENPWCRCVYFETAQQRHGWKDLLPKTVSQNVLKFRRST